MGQAPTQLEASVSGPEHKIPTPSEAHRERG